MARFAGIELGGTKSIGALAEGDRIVDRVQFPTLSPLETLPSLSAKLRDWQNVGPIAGLGIASFGPIRLSRDAPDYGHMLPTPKQGWSGADIAAALSDGVDCPHLLDTDVNAAALAEYRWGAGKGCSSLVYVTIGTGVGGGVLVEGRPVHGALHPELGHLRLRRAPEDSFAGACAFHSDCVEGLISGPALAERLGENPAQVAAEDPRWAPIAHDIAELAAAILLTLSAERVLIGGGVGIARSHLLPQIRDHVVATLAGYLPFAARDKLDRIIDIAALGPDAGPMGAIALAQAAAG